MTLSSARDNAFSPLEKKTPTSHTREHHFVRHFDTPGTMIVSHFLSHHPSEANSSIQSSTLHSHVHGSEEMAPGDRPQPHINSFLSVGLRLLPVSSVFSLLPFASIVIHTQNHMFAHETQTGLARLFVPELAFGVIRFWIFHFRFWKQVIQKPDLWQFGILDFSALIFVLCSGRTKDHAQKRRTNHNISWFHQHVSKQRTIFVIPDGDVTSIQKRGLRR